MRREVSLRRLIISLSFDEKPFDGVMARTRRWCR